MKPGAVCVVALIGASLLVGHGASAHHPGAQVGSTGSHLMSSMAGGSNQASQRALLLGQMTRTSEEPIGSPSTTYTTSLGAAVLVHPTLSVGARSAWVFVDQSDDWVNGYGDTVLELLLTPGEARPRRNVLSFGLTASLPTRTYDLVPEPGKMYSASPFAVFTRQEEHIFYQALLLTSIESRPAGIAWEAGAGVSMGYALEAGFGFAVGGRTDIRLVSYCRSPQGAFDYCDAGRVTEHHRSTGATRGYAVADVFYDGTLTLAAGVQVPVTSRRDFDLQVRMGAELEF